MNKQVDQLEVHACGTGNERQETGSKSWEECLYCEYAVCACECGEGEEKEKSGVVLVRGM